ncbi:hypothetical protein HPB48_008663 [Haemaphysalis longicornis]|uniref:Polypeptide N-acetylgalactosaminyltransferase n=1 Tax=Haemaphysalis longicornis TaxID=44386 RepID=A0A9J6GKF5_HAELO|nr:hypothetical protein HPB48_008663 [Haemaphysalis longicornis]
MKVIYFRRARIIKVICAVVSLVLLAIVFTSESSQDREQPAPEGERTVSTLAGVQAKSDARQLRTLAAGQAKSQRTWRGRRGVHECKYWDYPEDLPTTSVVVVFHNEGLSVVVRTVHSVINRSPRQFLKEVVLVDDFSDKEDLKEELETYIARNFPKGLVRLLRNEQREGLIRSRSYGAEQSRGDVVLFLDAHCEHFRGIFEWGMLYKEIAIPSQEVQRRKYHSEPYKSPTHAGGLFAIDRKYFLKLGRNFELSFKIWQCGGAIYWVPCSRVGHVYRGFMPYSFGELASKRKGPLITVNYKRVVEVWMDEYKEYFYTREPMARNYDAGDLTSQLLLRKKLKCKSFRWYMKNVAYDVLKDFPLLPKNLYWGEASSARDDGPVPRRDGRTPAVNRCSVHLSRGRQRQTKVFRLNAEGQLGLGERCMDATSDSMEVVYCQLGTVDGPWEYDADTSQLHHKRERRCLAFNEYNHKVHLAECVDGAIQQQWTFREIQDA